MNKFHTQILDNKMVKYIALYSKCEVSTARVFIWCQNLLEVGLSFQCFAPHLCQKPAKLVLKNKNHFLHHLWVGEFVKNFNFMSQIKD